ncbi:MAG: hypothetical protein ACXWNJ_04460 [Vulcanimicrobiaceae bacterium]
MSVDASAKATSEIRTTQFLFGAYVAILFIISVVTASLRTHPNTTLIAISAVVAFAMTLGGSIYLARIRTGDAKARYRYWAPFAIACAAFFGVIAVILAVLFIVLAHKRLDSPALRDYLNDPTPLPWLSW